MAKEETYEDLAAEFEAAEKKAREEFEKLPPEEQKQYLKNRKTCSTV
jgi:acyl-CoA reductase-like NAD-dependent aldehyde dehydrogenase